MRSAVNAVVHRLTSRLRMRATAAYRDSLGRDSTRTFRLLMLAAATFDRLAAAGRRLTDGRREVLRQLRTRAVSAAVQIAHRSGLTVCGAIIGGPDQISVRLTGPPALLNEVRALRLEPVGGAGDSVDLPTSTSKSDDVVRLAAVLPRAAFAAHRSTWRLAVTDGSRELETVVAERSAITNRWGDGDSWPPRLDIDDDRHLTVTGIAPEGTDVDHRVVVGMATATIEWDAAAEVTGALRLQLRDNSQTVVVATSAHRATVDLDTLVARGDGVWRASVRRTEDADRWEAVQLRRGEYPTLSELPALADLPVRRPDGTVARVRIAYSGSNRLTFDVRTSR